MFCRLCMRSVKEKDSRTVLRRVGKKYECFPNCGKRPSIEFLTRKGFLDFKLTVKSTR